MDELLKKLELLKSDKLKAFNQKLVSTKAKIIGVDVKTLKKLAKEDERFETLKDNEYLEIDLIKGFKIASLKDKEKQIKYLRQYAKTIDNWMTCDLIAAATSFPFEKQNLIKGLIDELLDKSTFEARFGLVLAMKYFAKNDFSYVASLIKKLKFGAYYLDMAVAWLNSYLLVFHFDEAISLIKELKKDSLFVYKMSLQKAVESRRISEEQKQIIKKLKGE